MKLLERYIFSKAIFAFLAVLFSLSGVIWIIQALTKIDVISSNGQSLLTYFTITFLAVPGLLLAIIPIALLISTGHTINAMNTNSELVVITASGASNKIVVKPFLIIALICSLGAGMVGHFVMPFSLTKLKNIVSSMNADLISLVVREGEFNNVESGLMFHIARRNADGTLGGILVVDSREEGKENIYIARKGVVVRSDDANLLQLEDGQIQQKDVATDQISTVKFTSYAIDMASISGKGKVPNYRPKEFMTSELLNPDINNSYYKNHPQKFSIEIHERFSEMLWPFANVIVLLAFAGQARSSRQGHGSAIFTASLLLIALRGASFGAQNYANSNSNGLFYMYLLPIIGILYGGWYLAKNQQASVPSLFRPWLDRYSVWAEQTRKKWFDAYLNFRQKIAA